MASMLSDEVESMGYQYWGGEFSRHGRRATLRVYIDSADGVTLDDCAKVSRRLSASLDLHDPIQSAYDLEISSPGVERPLFTPEHYRLYAGSDVAVRCFAPVEGSRRLVGRLEAVSDDGVDVNVDGELRRVSFDNVRSARLVYTAEAESHRSKEVNSG